jgi:hypothetical protein
METAMSAAIDAKSAKARATIAIRLLKTLKPWPQGYGCSGSREFSNCLGMGDVDEVCRIILERAKTDDVLAAAIHTQGCGHWYDLYPEFRPKGRRNCKVKV